MNEYGRQALAILLWGSRVGKYLSRQQAAQYYTPSRVWAFDEDLRHRDAPDVLPPVLRVEELPIFAGVLITCHRHSEPTAVQPARTHANPETLRVK